MLDEKKCFPHITLYMAQLPLKNISKIQNFLRGFVAAARPFRMTSVRYRQSDNGFVAVEYKKSKVISDFQKDIITLINPLREGLLRPKDEARMGALSTAKQNNIRRYGFQNVGASYSPHLTFTKFERSQDDALSEVEKINFSFDVASVGLFFLGEYCTCRRAVEIFDMSRK